MQELNFGITPIWFPKGSYDYIEQILRLARNEMLYRGNVPGIKKTPEHLAEKPYTNKEKPRVKNTLISVLKEWFKS